MRTVTETITLSIDGQEIQAEAGQTILQAARKEHARHHRPGWRRSRH